MERKIGEIFEYNGEWYQCIEADDNDCTGCDLSESCPYSKEVAKNTGFCSSKLRNDGKSVIFKKLEKVGEPFTCNIHGYERLVWMQEYKLYDVNFCKGNALLMYVSDYKHKRIAIEIKQTKEDMEEYRMHDAKEDIPEFDKVVDECLFGEDKLNLKMFDLEAAKAGKPVRTRDGRKARIICFDRKDNTPIVALIECVNHAEILQCVHNDGKCFHYDTSNNDLMMLPRKKEGWVNVYKGGLLDTKSYNTRKEAFDKACPRDYVDTVKISWHE